MNTFLIKRIKSIFLDNSQFTTGTKFQTSVDNKSLNLFVLFSFASRITSRITSQITNSLPGLSDWLIFSQISRFWLILDATGFQNLVLAYFVKLAFSWLF